MSYKHILTQSELHTIITENKYKIGENLLNFPTSTFPCDLENLAILLAASRQFAFDVDHKKALEVLFEVSGEKNISCEQCQYLNVMIANPEAYGLEENDILEIQKYIKGTSEGISSNVPIDGAMLLIKGGFDVLPEYHLSSEQGNQKIQLLITHQTIINARHHAWVEKLIESGAVTLYDSLDEEYLYEVISNTTDDYLFETARRLAKDLPIFQVTFAEDGTFKIEQQGFV